MRRKTLFSAGLLTAFLILIFPKAALAGAKSAFSIWFLSVLPALMPFSMACGLISRSGLAGRMIRPLSAFSNRLFRMSGNYVYIFLLAALSGYPMGAKIAGELYAEKAISKSEAEDAIKYSSVTGPMFINGSICISMLGKPSLIPYMLISHYLSALILALCFTRKRKRPVSTPAPLLNSELPGKERTFGGTLAESLTSSIEAMLGICANIVLFSVLTACLKEALLLVFGAAGALSALILGTLEMASGCASSGVVPFQYRVIYISALLGFGGLSVHSQTIALAQKSGLRLKGFFLFKALQGVTSALLLIFTMAVFPLPSGENTAYTARPGIAAAIFFALAAAAAIYAAFKTKRKPIRKLRSRFSG